MRTWHVNSKHTGGPPCGLGASIFKSSNRWEGKLSKKIEEKSPTQW
ncbi:hypothetical protein Cadr_000000246 [Camelus dromedarius]|uniref:Uncharacterized protein n=1 Tax=Camelus dromedarius TaxID=9838 RepID=A0A5N4EKD0_CAMDR|nr:hypothetical protein Cadr_000000246 [Camelus dromedarius]